MKRSMTGQGKKPKELEDFFAFLKSCERIRTRENIDPEQVFRMFDQDPEIFQKSWLQPLLAEGVALDRVCELVLESIFRPN